MADVPASVADFLFSLIRNERALAYLRVAPSMKLVETGGNLGNYGLASLEIGRPVCEQAVFLEGLLPLPAGPLRLESVQMPSGRAADLHLYPDGQGAWVVLLDVTAERDDTWRLQQRAYEMTLLSEREAELIQRFEAANRTLQRTQLALEQSREALVRANRRLQLELAEAANYVRSILPPPLTEPFVADWRFVPSTELGGDSFGYHWIDQDHFALYVLDVCGHGVGSALLSVAASNTLRSHALPNTDFREPGEVLSQLNQAFLMENNNNLYLTVWYGVFHRVTRRLRYACAGHPPALLMRGEPRGVARIDELRTRGPVLGITSSVTYRTQECTVPAPSRLFLMSDGVYEVQKPDGTMLEFSQFLDVLAEPASANESELDRLLEFVHALHGPGPLEDDFSIVKFEL